jgi:hypothetical protein
MSRSDLDDANRQLRSLTDELRDHAVPATAAVTRAARTLHGAAPPARRTAFGDLLPRARAWTAALVIAPMLIWFVIQAAPYGSSLFLDEALAGLLLAIALVVPLSWARPILFGGFAFFAIPSALTLVLVHDASPIYVLWNVAVVALLGPWRRGELTSAGWNLALQTWTLSAASFALMFQFTTEDGGVSRVMPLAAIGVVTSLLATIGAIARARWSGVLSGLSAVTLIAAMIHAFGLRFQFDQPDVVMAFFIALVTSGAIAATVGAWLGWRTARSSFGTLDYLAH